MAYTNQAQTIFEAMREDIHTEVKRVEIEYREAFPEDLTRKYGKGIVFRCVSDVQSDVGSSNYEDRLYQFQAMVYRSDADRDQENITDLAEHVKYALIQNKEIVSNTAYLIRADVEYPEPEEEDQIKTALITIEVLYDG